MIQSLTRSLQLSQLLLSTNGINTHYTDIATTKLNRPRGRCRENLVVRFFCCNFRYINIPVVYCLVAQWKDKSHITPYHTQCKDKFHITPHHTTLYHSQCKDKFHTTPYHTQWKDKRLLGTRPNYGPTH